MNSNVAQKEPMQGPYSDSSYVLVLDDGLAWCLVGSTSTLNWLAHLASIMTLNSGKPAELRRLNFTLRPCGILNSQEPRNHPFPASPLNLPYNGWQMYDLLGLRVWSHPEAPDTVCELVDAENHEVAIFSMGQAVFPIYQAVIGREGLPFHAALLEYDGKGILVAGRGGKGKTTCCKRAPKHWDARCDDETLVVRTGSGLYNAHPFPTWSDYLTQRAEPKWDVQRPTPLWAIFFLDRGESDQIIPLGQAEAAARITQSAGQVCGRMWQRLDRSVQRENNLKLFANACNMAREIPAFSLRASLTGRFWESIEKVL